MNESQMRKRVVQALRSLDALAVENAVRAGTPDVNYIEGWLELKRLTSWPRKEAAVVRIPIFTPQQRVWLRRRQEKGGNVHFLILVANDWLLFDGSYAADHLGRITKQEMFDHCLMHCVGQLDGKLLHATLRHGERN